MKKLYVLAPNDRFNYGDLLFSHILKQYFSGFFDKVIFCSTVKSDFSLLGGIPTESYSVLYEANRCDENYLIIAGGESLFVSWRAILSYIDSNIKTRKMFPNSRILSSLAWRLQSVYMRLKYRPHTLYPYTIGKFELSGFKCVVYNSVGNCKLFDDKHLMENKMAKKIVEDNDYLAVRDELTHTALNKIGIENSLVADSAILMSKCFSESFLESSLSLDKQKYSKQEYIYFQLGKAYLNGREKEYAVMLDNIGKKYKLKICLGVIATAIDHEDHVALANIAKHLNPDSYLFYKSPNLWDIMWLIKNSKLYVGTSLHGAITAMSFGVPICAHGPKKLERYLIDWGGTIGQMSFVDEKSLEQSMCAQLDCPQIVDASKQFSSINQSFDKIKNIFNKK